MKGDRYSGISLNQAMIEKIKKAICKSGNYTSITEFIREAIREKLERINDNHV
jgi:Arc/MetJ-type ribon-helix-helix transcriptional regulator